MSEIDTASAAYETMKAELADIDRSRPYLGLASLPALAAAHGMQCIDNSEGMDGIDQSFVIQSGERETLLVYTQLAGDFGTADRITLYLTMTDAGEPLDEIEIEDIIGPLNT